MTTDPWGELAAELAALIPRLRDGDVLILTGGQRYVQLQQTPSVLCAEAVANRFLPVDRRLSPEAERDLARLGWRSPNPPLRNNWSRDSAWPLRARDAADLARLLVGTLRDVFEVPDPAQLEERAFNSIDDSEAGPGGLASLRPRPVTGRAAGAEAPVDGPANARGMAELLVVRHGESTANAAFAVAEAGGLVDSGITGRDADVPLSEVGRAQAAALGRWLAALPDERFPEVAVCSPYRRADETLRIALDEARAAGRRVPEPIVDARLRDRETGDLELLTTAAIRERFPAEAARRAEADEFEYRPPGGESMMDVAARLRELYTELTDRYADRRVLVMAHDAVVLMFRHVIDGESINELRRVVAAGPVRNASVTRWVRDGARLRLREYNLVPTDGGRPEAEKTEDDSILGRLRPHGWSPEEVTAYEIAIDGINRVIGIYTGRLHEQRDDPAALAGLRAEIARWADVQRQLRVGDHERVAEVRRQCSAIVRAADGRPAP